MNRNRDWRLFGAACGYDSDASPALGRHDGKVGCTVDMDFELSEEQRLLKDSVERLTDAALRLRGAQEIHGGARRLEPRAVEAVCRARPHRRCRSPRSTAASAAAPVETMIVMEAFGRALALEPYFATVVLGGGFLRRGASDGAARRRCCRRSRPARRCSPSRIPSGRRATTSPTWPRRRRRTAPATCSTARRASSLHGDCADKIIVSARVSGDAARPRTASGCSWSTPRRRASRAAAIRRMDGLRAAEVTLAGVKVGADAVIGEPGNAFPLIEQRGR